MAEADLPREQACPGTPPEICPRTTGRHLHLASPWCPSSERATGNLGVAEADLRREQSKKGGKDQESIQSSITPVQGYQWGK